MFRQSLRPDVPPPRFRALALQLQPVELEEGERAEQLDAALEEEHHLRTCLMKLIAMKVINGSTFISTVGARALSLRVGQFVTRRWRLGYLNSVGATVHKERDAPTGACYTTSFSSPTATTPRI